jgi:hypothetical protein
MANDVGAPTLAIELEQNVEPFRRKIFWQKLRPLHQQRALTHRFFEPDLVKLARGAHAIKVGVHDLQARQCMIKAKGKCRALDIEPRIVRQRTEQCTGERGLSRAEAS